MTERDKDDLAKIAYFFRHTMSRMNVAQSALTGEDIANWNGAAMGIERICKENGIHVCGDLK